MRSADPLSRAGVDGVHRIAVFRPSAVGDFIFALPTLDALRRTYPEAKIVYLGKAWHAEFLRGRPGPVDTVALVPPCPGIGAPPDIDPGPMQAFIDAMRAMLAPRIACHPVVMREIPPPSLVEIAAAMAGSRCFTERSLNGTRNSAAGTHLLTLNPERCFSS